jgi:hypothetical protein
MITYQVRASSTEEEFFGAEFFHRVAKFSGFSGISVVEKGRMLWRRRLGGRSFGCGSQAREPSLRMTVLGWVGVLGGTSLMASP